MKAVVKVDPRPGAEFLDVEDPRPGRRDVIVKVKATSICGTDVHIYKWNEWAEKRIGRDNLQQILGHEVAGEAVEVGSDVRMVRVGDYLSCETHIYDPRDITALLGQFHIGEKMEILGVDTDGAFAEYIKVPESVCWINDEIIPPEIASIQEPLGNAAYAVFGEDNDIAGRSMTIIGDGPIAILAVGVARVCGVTPIFHIGKYDLNMEIGKKMGSDHQLYANRKFDRVDYIRDHTGGYGTDIVLDMVGSYQALEEGFKILRKGGRFTAFGIPASSPSMVDYRDGIVFKGAQVHGISGRKIFDTWYRVRSLLAGDRLDVRPVITHLFSLSDYKEGFDKMLERPRKSAKIVLFPDRDELKKAMKRRSE